MGVSNSVVSKTRTISDNEDAGFQGRTYARIPIDGTPGPVTHIYSNLPDVTHVSAALEEDTERAPTQMPHFTGSQRTEKLRHYMGIRR